MNPYLKFVSEFARLVTDGKSLPLGTFAPRPQPRPAPDAPVLLLFSPHPDDECVIGGFALRLMREAGLRVINVAVTQGSNKPRQQPRWEELKKACDWLGFELEATVPGGLERITPKARANEPEHWAPAVRIIAASLLRHRPQVIFFPHDADWNGTHLGTHHLVMDALQTLPASFQTFLVETEFWGQMQTPNLMVESSAEDLGDLLTALSFHVGEVQRNPYHLLMPPWMQDNVRRGAELVGGQGGGAPDFMFATIYRLRQWKQGRVEAVHAGGRLIGVRDWPGSVFGWSR